MDFLIGMTKELIITEKPSAAFRIAESLADSKVETMKTGGVTYYSIKRGTKTITIVPAVGHLFTVAEKKAKGKDIPYLVIPAQAAVGSRARGIQFFHFPDARLKPSGMTFRLIGCATLQRTRCRHVISPLCSC